MSVDLLFIDEKATLTQGSIGASRHMRFRERLSEGSIYTLNNFDVARSNTNFRLCDSPFMIRFTDATKLEKKTESVSPIPMELFRFLPYSQLLDLANTGKQLPDVIGEVNAIRSTITDCIPGAQRVMLTLCLQSGDNVCVSMFDSVALSFHAKFDAFGKEPKIVLATSINPKIVAGRLYLNATSGTHLYVDSETTAGKEVYDTLVGHGDYHAATSSKIIHAQKIEPLTVSELNQFINTSDSQVIEFLCTAKVTGIQQEDGWSYIACSKCSKKLVREATSFTCVSCNESNAFAALRYRVTLSVSDGTDTASFLGFDLEMAKLTNLQASEAAQIVGIGVDARVDTDLPRSLSDIVGKTYTFQLKLNDFNFTAKHHTFTISRIFPERALAPLPSFAEHGSSNVTQGEQSVTGATRTEASSGEPAATPDGGATDNKAKKKARVE